MLSEPRSKRVHKPKGNMATLTVARTQRSRSPIVPHLFRSDPASGFASLRILKAGQEIFADAKPDMKDITIDQANRFRYISTAQYSLAQDMAICEAYGGLKPVLHNPLFVEKPVATTSATVSEPNNTTSVESGPGKPRKASSKGLSEPNRRTKSRVDSVVPDLATTSTPQQAPATFSNTIPPPPAAPTVRKRTGDDLSLYGCSGAMLSSQHAKVNITEYRARNGKWYEMAPGTFEREWVLEIRTRMVEKNVEMPVQQQENGRPKRHCRN